MSRALFLSRLKAGLTGMPPEELRDVVADYEAHFAEAQAAGRSETEVEAALGDPARGRQLIVDRSSTCILCHSGPFPEQKFQGDLAPNLAGAGSRWSEGQLRLRLVDASRLNPITIMPSFYRVDGLDRVGAAWRDKPILSAEQIEDIVAYLATLRD